MGESVHRLYVKYVCINANFLGSNNSIINVIILYNKIITVLLTQLVHNNDIVVMYENVLLRRFRTLNYIVMKCLDVWTLSQEAQPLKKNKKERNRVGESINKKEREGGRNTEKLTYATKMSKWNVAWFEKFMECEKGKLIWH